MNGPLHLWLIPLLPFIGFLLNGLLGRRLPKAVVSAIALLAPLGSFLVVLNAVSVLIRRPMMDPCMGCPPAPHWINVVLPHTESLGTWITAGSFNVDLS